jgi:hypothetical protein
MFRISVWVCACILSVSSALPTAAQTWTALNNEASFGAGTALLLTDGRVMVQQSDAGGWWTLTPDKTGSYINGSWTEVASLPSGYGPLYYASAVLPDGRLIIEGGEYNFGNQIDTNLGAIYDPVANTWTAITPPAGWSNIGDAPSVILNNGTFMLADPFSTATVLFNPSTFAWTPVGSGKIDSFSEEGMTLLPNGDVLVVDTENGTHAERFNSSTNRWGSAGNTGVVLPSNGGMGIVPELGPQVLRPDGSVLANGATANTSVYYPAVSKAGTGYWIPGPTFPTGVMADAPAALLITGNVLVDTSPFFGFPSTFFEFDGVNFNAVPAPPNAPNDSSYYGRMLDLPSGQVLFTDGSSGVEIYTPSGSYNSSWAPIITSVPSSLTAGETYEISGLRFNGLSQAAAYGDDAQMATNYPLVRITNSGTGNVVYCKTHGHSTMAVATGNRFVSTNFDVPSGIGTGASTIVVVANGIPSRGVSVTVAADKHSN